MYTVIMLILFCTIAVFLLQSVPLNVTLGVFVKHLESISEFRVLVLGSLVIQCHQPQEAVNIKCSFTCRFIETQPTPVLQKWIDG